MKALLLNGYRTQEPLGAGTLLDQQILNLLQLKLDPIVVIAGPFADEIILQSQWLERCELVYDGTEKANVFSNVRAGLKATDEACFVLPVEIPAPPEHVWKALKLELVKAGLKTKEHVFQFTHMGAPWHYGFPLLISASGNRFVCDLEQDGNGLCDQRLRFQYSTPPLESSFSTASLAPKSTSH